MKKIRRFCFRYFKINPYMVVENIEARSILLTIGIIGFFVLLGWLVSQGINFISQ